MNRVYINSMDDAQRAVEEIVRLVESGKVRPIVGLDVETAPLPGLEGYPGTLFETVEVKTDDGGTRTEEKVVRAKKQTYLEFVQRIWKGSFAPSMLQMLKLYIPKKTISGKEDGIDAKVAWANFLRRLYELEASEPETGLLAMARWTKEGLDGYLARLGEEIDALTDEGRQLEDDIHSMDVMGVKKGLQAKQRSLKKVNVRLAELCGEHEFLSSYARERLETPIDLRLLLHVAKVAVEGRIYLDKGGRNRMDPVQPGLDPFTSTIFLVQVTLQRKGSGELLSWAFNTHKIDIRALRPVLELKKVEYLGANIKFDLKMLAFHAGKAPQKVFCTRIGSRMMNLGRKRMPHSLAAVYKRYCGVDISKEVRNTFIGRRYLEVTPEQMEYAFNDTEILPELYDAMLKVAREREQENLVRNFSNLSWLVGVKWELEGFRLDVDRWLEIAAEAAKSRDELARELEQMLLPAGYGELFGAPTPQDVIADAVNDALFEDEDPDLKNTVFGEEEDDTKPAVDVRANPTLRISQTELVKTLLGNLLGMNLPRLFKDGKVSLGKDGRSLMEREYRKAHSGEGHPFFQMYALWSKRAKQASTYGKRFLWYIHPLTGRIHPTFNIGGTDTARFTGTNPNLLNIPAAKEPGDPDFRSAFLAPEGCYLLGADYDAMEFRIGGNEAQDPVVKKMVETGVDAHAFTAANMFHIEIADVAEPVVKDTVYRRGTTEFPIKVWRVPASWTPQQVIDFAAQPDVIDYILHGGEKGKALITRGDGKTVTFRWQFRGGPWGLAEKTGLPVETCEALMGRFVKVYVVMDSYLNQVADCVYSQRMEDLDGTLLAYSVGYNGIRRYVELPEEPFVRMFPNYPAYRVAEYEYKRMMSRAKRELANLPMQGGNAVVTCEALLFAVERGERLGIYPWLSIYDEIIVAAPEAVKPIIAKGIIESAMLDAADAYMQYVPAGATADVGKAGPRWVKS